MLCAGYHLFCRRTHTEHATQFTYERGESRRETNNGQDIKCSFIYEIDEDFSDRISRALIK